MGKMNVALIKAGYSYIAIQNLQGNEIAQLTNLLGKAVTVDDRYTSDGCRYIKKDDHKIELIILREEEIISEEDFKKEQERIAGKEKDNPAVSNEPEQA